MLCRLKVIKKRERLEKTFEARKYCRVAFGAIIFTCIFPGLCPGLILKLSSDSLYKREPMEDYLYNEVY